MRILALVFIIGILFAFFQFSLKREGANRVLDDINIEQSIKNVGETSATNYDECIALGNPSFDEDGSKCLTKDGHVFIKGVIEETE